MASELVTKRFPSGVQPSLIINPNASRAPSVFTGGGASPALQPSTVVSLIEPDTDGATSSFTITGHEQDEVQPLTSVTVTDKLNDELHPEPAVTLTVELVDPPEIVPLPEIPHA